MYLTKVKANIGAGVLAMPLAFKNAGK